MKIYTIGHLSPDLDTVASAYIYAKFLTEASLYPDCEIVPLVSEEPNHETKTIFAKFKAELPRKITDIEITDDDRFILVDHNEEAQRHPLVVGDRVLEIIDHHKINISFTTPIKIDVRPLASTCSIIHLLYKAHSISPSKVIEELVLSAILSDTSGLKSPTTTGTDSTLAHQIAEKHNMNIDELIFEIYKAKSEISQLSIAELIKKDYKIFDFGGKKVFIGTVETVEPHKVLEKLGDIVPGLNELKPSLGVSHAFLCVTDMLKVNTKVIYETEEEGSILAKAFTAISEGNVSDIGPRISRKKEIAPAIEAIITQA